MRQSRYRKSNWTCDRQVFACFLFAVLGLGFCASSAWAHRVMIFAWVEGDTVHTQSKFSGGKKAKNATVMVYDEKGNHLLEGKTDEKGACSFKVPKKTTLKIVLKASMGHLAEWTIPEEEITQVADSAQSTTAGFDVDVYSQQPAPVVTLGRDEIQTLIDGSLDRKLAPVLTMLSEALDSGPGMTEVIGGIGYIIGLVGVGLYVTARGKRKELR